MLGLTSVRVASVVQIATPMAYRLLVQDDSMADSCRIGGEDLDLGIKRPFSGVTVVKNFATHRHLDELNSFPSITCVRNPPVFFIFG